MEKKKKWLKWVAWILLTPVLLFVLLMILLYVPPVQNFLRKQITSIASESTGMDISVERIDLRFPLNLLVRGVQVIQPADVSAGVMKPDTLLTLESLNVHVQAWPLLRGQVEVDDITLNQATVNTSNLVDGMLVKGVLGNFSLKSHGINLMNETVVLNDVELADTHLQVMLADTTEAVPDTTSTPVNWKVKLNTMRLKTYRSALTCRSTRCSWLPVLKKWDWKMPLSTWDVSFMAGAAFSLLEPHLRMIPVRLSQPKVSTHRT